MPGAPTIYYGDEVALSGDDDPDNRRTYPWTDLGGNPDTAMFSHYQALAGIREANPALVAGDFQVLLADDASGVVAYGRKTASQAAVVIINRGASPQTGKVPVGGFLPDGIVLQAAYVVGSGSAMPVTVANGMLIGTVGPNSALLLVTGTIDLTPLEAPTGLVISNEGNAEVGLTWNGVPGAASYNVYRSPVSGGGWVKANDAPLNGTSFTDTGLANAKPYYFAVTAVDMTVN
jgi:hypothetical protein